ncbi:TolB family protein [Nocardioides ferulae]|uniref:TolB family protein n=1 Tax=Nocardioides ferulae TaxID=2340821 RepID=UPI000EACA9AE|nr:hypothetical protein [Nocardioides ferulae]
MPKSSGEGVVPRPGPRVVVRAPDGRRRTLAATTTLRRAASGRWQVDGHGIDLGDQGVLWPRTPTQAARIRTGRSAVVAVSYAVTVPATTQVASADDVADAQTQPDGTVIVETTGSAPTTPGAPDGSRRYEAGDVLVAGPTPELPYGLLGRVTDVTAADGGARLTVDPEGASLLDAVAEAQLATAPRTLSADQLRGTTPTARAVKRATDRRDSDGSADSLFTDLDALGENVACEAGGQLVVEGGFEIAAEIGFEAGWDWGWDGGELDHARAYATADQSAHLIATATGDASCTLDETELLADPLEFRTFTVWAGPVPVVFTPQLQFYADGLVEAHAEAEYGYRQSMGVSAEVGWDRESGGYGDHDVDPPTLERIGPNFDGSAHAELGVTAEATLLLYGLVGPHLGLRGALLGDAALDASAQDGPEAAGEWSLGLGLGVTGGIDVDALELESDDLDIWDNYDDPWIIASGRWAFGDGDLPGSLTNLTAELDRDGGNYWAEVPELSADGAVAAWWLADPDTQVGFVHVQDIGTGATERLTPPVWNLGPTSPISQPKFALSADARWVALSGDSGAPVWLYDRSTGRYTRVAAQREGVSSVDVTRDGSVAWVEEDASQRLGLYWWDAATRERSRIAVPDGVRPIRAQVSDDGTRLLLEAVDESSRQAYLLDRNNGEWTLISADRRGLPAEDGLAETAALSGDGGTAVFLTRTPLLGEAGTHTRLYRWHDARLTLIADDATLWQPWTGWHGNRPRVSGDGRYTAYAVGSGADGADLQVELHDADTGERRTISQAFTDGGTQNGEVGDGWSFYPALDGDGDTVVFLSTADNLTDDDPSGGDVLLWRRSGGGS